MMRFSVAIDPTKELVISLRRLGMKLPERVSKTTVHRWVKVGITRSQKAPVKLESIRMPWGIGTSMEAYKRFIKRLNS